MKTIGALALLLAAIGSWTTGRPTPSPSTDAPALKLVWADEFDRNGPPDPAKWTFEQGFVRNEELQYYQPVNAFCLNGHLVIEGRRDSLKIRATTPTARTGAGTGRMPVTRPPAWSPKGCTSGNTAVSRCGPASTPVPASVGRQRKKGKGFASFNDML